MDPLDPTPTTTDADRPSGRPLDSQFADLLVRLGGVQDPLLWASAALVSRQLGQGHLCVELAEHAGTAFEFGERQVKFPSADAWAQALCAWPMVHSGQGNASAPLVLHAGHLYLQRYWAMEQRLAQGLLERRITATEPVDLDWLRTMLERLFGPPGDELDWQRVATANAVLQPLAVIAGGPGTGKTHVVTQVVALLGAQAARNNHKRLRLALAAPTGKAAARLAASIGAGIANLPRELQQATQVLVPNATTLHRLIGLRGDPTRPRHQASNPLSVDVLVIDEASMIDLPLLTRTLDALPRNARLLLLGDPDQLASVEAGAALAEVCTDGHGFSAAGAARLGSAAGQSLPETGDPVGTLADQVVTLVHSRRFARAANPSAPTIGAFASAVRGGDAAQVRGLLQRATRVDDPAAELHFFRASSPVAHAAVFDEMVARARQLASLADPRAALDALHGFQVLCALREGPWGTLAVNREIEQRLGAGPDRSGGYSGWPFIVRANSRTLGLHNGDTGVVLTGPDGALRAYVRDSNDGSLRDFAPHRLPAHEAAYAITVHKSQGSEYQNVVMLLPPQPSPVLTRELLYTGVTRARRALWITGDADLIATTAAERPTRRASGLARALQQLAQQETSSRD